MSHFVKAASLIEVYVVLIKTESNYLTTSNTGNLRTLELER